MKQDITSRADIERLINAFYNKALKDELIGHFFVDVVQDNWPQHVRKICDFWEGVLLGSQAYSGNPMTVHYDLHKKYPMESVHFDRWLMLWEDMVNELFAGSVAREAVSRAKNIAGLMAHKIISQ